MRLLGVAVTLIGVSLTVACEGGNLFSVIDGPGGAGQDNGEPPVVQISVPRGDSLTAMPLADSVLVTAVITDDVGVSSVRMYGVAFRGDVDLGTDEVVLRFEEKAISLPAGVVDTTVTRYLLPTADSVKETAFIVVEAQDTLGNIAADTVQLILGGPDVDLLNMEDGQSVQAGLNLSASFLARDPLGIVRVRLDITGAFTTTLNKSFPSSPDSVLFDTLIAIPAAAIGPMQVVATAWNALDVAGQDGPLTLNVISAGAGDTLAPQLKHLTVAPELMELQDSLVIEVSGSDDSQGSGIARVGFTLLGISPTRGDTVVVSGETTYSPARTGTVSRAFKVPAPNVDSLNLPDTVSLNITSWMVDADGNCSASVGRDSLVAYACGALPGGEIVAANRTGEALQRVVVSGQTVLLPGGGSIMDAVVDTTRKKLFLSNITNNRLEVFDLEARTFGTAIGVGSEPWGLALTRDSDSLWVANSGGSNLSVVNLDTEREEDDDRLLPPDVLLFDVKLEVGEGSIAYLVTSLPGADPPAFSDRPQFAAVDSFGSVVFSTKTSLLGDLGTARKAFYTPGWERSEAKVFVEHGLFARAEDSWAVAHVDSFTTGIDTLSVDTLGVATIAARMAIYDHVPGFPDDVIVGLASSDVFGAVESAVSDLRAQGSDVFIAAGSAWDLPSITFGDTTYVAASGDGGWVGIGEGAVSAQVGRVLMYKANPGPITSLSGWTQVSNLLNNPSEQVRGLGLNNDGTMAVIRGRAAAYFITPADLLTQGQTLIPAAEQGSGAALHPLHADSRSLDNLDGAYQPDTHLAFVGSGLSTVDIIDTQRFTRVGRLYLRDIVTGPLRAVLPFPEDNAGYTCSSISVQNRENLTIGEAIQLYEGRDFSSPIAADGITEDRCVVMKLFATTSGGGVVVVNVRKSDILREHPSRN